VKKKLVELVRFKGFFMNCLMMMMMMIPWESKHVACRVPFFTQSCVSLMCSIFVQTK